MFFLLVAACFPEPLPKFVDVPAVHQYSEKSIYADVMSRTSNHFLGHGRDTNAHETVHHIQSVLRNAHGGRVNAFYVLNGKAVICKEPGVKISYVGKFCPRSLRSYRWPLYCEQQQQYWNNEPLYLVDEWSAYVIGCAVSLEEHQTGRGKENSDAASGTLEMGIYSIAMAMAVEKYDPDYFKNDTQFLPFMKYQWKRAHDLYIKAAPLFPSDNQTRQLKALQTSPDAEAMRAFITKHLDGVWLK
jgi:hypothetical protein